jgi:hypothetical protein
MLAAAPCPSILRMPRHAWATRIGRAASAVLVLLAGGALGCARKAGGTDSPTANSAAPSSPAFARGLRLDQSLEEATHALVEDISASSLDDFALLKDLSGHRSARAVEEWLLELLGLPAEDASRVAGERARELGRARFDAAIRRVVSELKKRGVVLDPAHVDALFAREPPR